MLHLINLLHKHSKLLFKVLRPRGLGGHQVLSHMMPIIHVVTQQIIGWTIGRSGGCQHKCLPQDSNSGLAWMPPNLFLVWLKLSFKLSVGHKLKLSHLAVVFLSLMCGTHIFIKRHCFVHEVTQNDVPCCWISPVNAFTFFFVLVAWCNIICSCFVNSANRFKKFE